MPISVEEFFELAKSPDLVGTITEIQPTVKNVIDAVFASGENIESAFLRIVKSSARLKSAYFKQFESDGFSREEALILTCNSWENALSDLQKSNASAKNK